MKVQYMKAMHLGSFLFTGLPYKTDPASLRLSGHLWLPWLAVFSLLDPISALLAAALGPLPLLRGGRCKARTPNQWAWEGERIWWQQMVRAAVCIKHVSED